MSLTHEIKRNRKIVRTLIRLKHSLRADDDIDEYLAAEQEALKRGETLVIGTKFSDILDES